MASQWRRRHLSGRRTPALDQKGGLRAKNGQDGGGGVIASRRRPTTVYGFPPTQTWMTFKSYGASPLIEYKLPRTPSLSRAVRSVLAALSYSDPDFVGYKTQTPPTVSTPTGDLFIRSNFGIGDVSGCSIQPPNARAASILSTSRMGSISTVMPKSKCIPANGLIASAISCRCCGFKSRGAIRVSSSIILDCCADIVSCCAELIDLSYENKRSVKNTQAHTPPTTSMTAAQSLQVLNFDSNNIPAATPASERNVPTSNIVRVASWPNRSASQLLMYARCVAILGPRPALSFLRGRRADRRGESPRAPSKPWTSARLWWPCALVRGQNQTFGTRLNGRSAQIPLIHCRLRERVHIRSFAAVPGRPRYGRRAHRSGRTFDG